MFHARFANGNPQKQREKNKGEATGNKKQRTAQRTAEKASFTLAS